MGLCNCLVFPAKTHKSHMWHSLTIQTEVGHINPDNTDAYKDDVMGVIILRNLNQSGYPQSLAQHQSSRSNWSYLLLGEVMCTHTALSHLLAMSNFISWILIALIVYSGNVIYVRGEHRDTIICTSKDIRPRTISHCWRSDYRNTCLFQFIFFITVKTNEPGAGLVHCWPKPSSVPAVIYECDLK